MPRTARYETRDLVLIAREACGSDMAQLEVLDRHLSFGWDVNKVSGYAGKPHIIFLSMKRTDGSYAYLCVTPGGRVERQMQGKKSLRVQLPR